MLITVFDSETTGLSTSQILNPEFWPHIVQFSYIVYDTKQMRIVEIKDSIIKLPKGVIISAESAGIHGITNEITEEKGVDICGVLAEFIGWCDKSDLIIGHNVEFDYNMVIIELMRTDAPFVVSEKFKTYKKFVCTMKTTVDICNIKAISKKGKEYTKFPTLLELHKHLFSAEPLKLHNSLNDVLVCLRCFYKIKFCKDLVEESAHIKKLMAPLLHV